MKKTKGFVSEFKEFVLRGNVMDLAVAVIIGAAFQVVVNSLVNDVIMPVITLVTGGINFNDWFISLDGGHYETLEAAQAAGASTLNYGVFITAVINFLIMMFVIFLLIKFLNRIANAKKREAEAVPATTRICPFCKNEVPIAATRCGYCTSELLPVEEEE